MQIGTEPRRPKGKISGRRYLCRQFLPGGQDRQRLDDAMVQRLLGPLRAKAQAQLDAQVVADADLVDAGMIFGAGYAPFTGGPLHLDS